MAEEPSQQGLNCKICLQIFTEPKKLPCRHTFCLKCLHTLVLDDQPDAVRCPTCKVRSVVPPGGFAQFKDNASVAAKIDKMETMLDRCATGKHAEKFSHWMCMSCDVQICTECRSKDHSDHTVKSVSEATSFIKNGLQDGMVRLVDCKRVLEAAKGEADANEDAMLKKRDSLATMLADRKKQAVQMVEKAFSDALATLDKSTSTISAYIQNDSWQIENRIEAIKEIQQDVREAFERGRYRQVVKVQEDLNHGRGSFENLQRLTSGLPYHTERPVLVFDDHTPIIEAVRLFIGHVVTFQPVTIKPEVTVKRQFRCFEDKHEDVQAICPRKDGKVWLALGDSCTSKDGSPRTGWVGLHARDGTVERKEHITGHVCIAHLTSDLVLVEGMHYTAHSMTAGETLEWHYAGTPLLYRVYCKNKARFSIGVSKSGECELRSLWVTGDRHARIPGTKSTRLSAITVKNPVAMDASRDGKTLAVLEARANNVLLFNLDGEGQSSSKFATYITPFAVYRSDSPVFKPRDVCFWQFGSREVLVVADWLGEALHVLEVTSDSCQFLGHVGSQSPFLIKPSALSYDEDGRLWVGCRFGNVLTLQVCDESTA